MEQPLLPTRDGYDVAIKVLTIIKLLIEVALWGLALGLTIWLLTHNPLPKLMESFSEQITKSLSGGTGH